MTPRPKLIRTTLALSPKKETEVEEWTNVEPGVYEATDARKTGRGKTTQMTHCMVEPSS
jgi:hypothetical protein